MALTKVSRGLLSTGIVDNSNATAITIDSSENVLVGSGKVVIGGTSSNQLLNVTSSTTPAIEFTRGSDNATIGIDNGSSIAVGATAGDLVIRASGTTGVTRFTDSGGDITMTLLENNTLLVGKLADDNSVGFKTNTSSTYMVSNTATPVFINRLGNVGDLIEFRQDSSTVGSIGTVSGSLSLGSGDCYLEMSGTGNVIQPMGSVTGAASNGVINLGASARRFKDLYLSGGVYLGGTGSANELSDYEEGTFSLAVVSPSSGVTLSSGSGKYTKVGRLVTLHFVVRFSAVTTDMSSVVFSGQPFESSTNTIHQPGMARETDNVGAIYVLQVNHTSDRIAMNSMDGVSDGSQRTIRINEDYNCFICYTTQA